jgi:leukotriene A-4 hydrolase/aminopeptidase
MCRLRYLSFSLLLFTVMACNRSSQDPVPQLTSKSSSGDRDLHSYSNPNETRVKHVLLNLDVLFAKKTLQGFAVLEVERTGATENGPLIVDTRHLDIAKVETAEAGEAFFPTTFKLGPQDKILGAPLTIQLPPKTTRVRIHYSTSPEAEALQWLAPTQTAGKKHPFLFSQSQAIHARSWIPLQDTPEVRVTYTAILRAPKELVAVMSAENDPLAARTGEYRFKMTQPIPSYLIALAVGDLTFKPLGERTGVYAEPIMIAKATREFDDTEKMLMATEKLYGPYRWGRYDLLVLPPSFPFGGMENPRLTFATPTIIAGDKSLVALVAHELAHSWSGNLVTNATWSDFWLNEGFTNYVTQRIIETVYGPERAAMEEVLERQELMKLLQTLPANDQVLHIDLAGRDPDDGVTEIPYVKGATFLRHLEKAYGRARFDAFLRGYFDHFAFQSVHTSDFVKYLNQHLIASGAADPGQSSVPVEEWIYKPGIPAGAPQPSSEAFAKVEKQAQQWLSGQLTVQRLETAGWSYHEWQHFLRSLPTPLSHERMHALDRAFRFSQSGNAEIVQQWLLIAIRSNYASAYPKLEEFLLSVGRRKFLKPLYAELAKTEGGQKRALSIYRKARLGYHPIAVATIDEILKWKEEGGA